MAFRRIKSDAATMEEQSTEGQLQSSPKEEVHDDMLDWARSTESNRSSDFVIAQRNQSQGDDVKGTPTHLSDAQTSIVDQFSSAERQLEAAAQPLPIAVSANEEDASSNTQQTEQGKNERNDRLPAATVSDVFTISNPQLDQPAPISMSKEAGDGLTVASDYDADSAKANQVKTTSFQFSIPSDEATVGNPASGTEGAAFVSEQSAPGAVATSPGESTEAAEDFATGRIHAQTEQTGTTASVTPRNPFDTFVSMASQFQQSFHSSMHPEANTERQPEVLSTAAPPTHSSRTDTAMTPDVAPAHANRIFTEANNNMHSSHFLQSGPPTEIVNQSQPLSAVSGLDSSIGSPDPISETPDMMRLQVELREAIKLAESTDVPETKLLWRTRASELQRKLSESRNQQLQRPQHQMATEGPLQQEQGFQYNDEYYAMYNESADNGQGHVQPLEYDSSRMVDVIAPADLPGGYHFEAEIEGQRFLATVPAGGVQQGETFTCYMRELNSVAIDIPVGYWKDNLCHMCMHGLCHPTLWHGLFCPLSK